MQQKMEFIIHVFKKPYLEPIGKHNTLIFVIFKNRLLIELFKVATAPQSQNLSFAQVTIPLVPAKVLRTSTSRAEL